VSQTLPRIEVSAETAGPIPAETTGPVDLADRARVVERPPVVEIAIPVFNEEDLLEANTRRLRAYLDESFPFESTIRIVDNASTDGTWDIAVRLASRLPGVTALRLEEKGKGRAVRAAWSTSSAQIVCYMDVDLSTDLGGLLPLVAPLLSGHSDVAIGSRFANGAHVLRGARRELVSRLYNVMLRGALRPHFTDATCGFKAARRETAQALLPLVRDDRWFFDTEFLVLAERNGFRIHEVPVDWVDDSDSHVHVTSVAKEDLRGVLRLIRNRATGHERLTHLSGTGKHLHSTQSACYASVGIVSTIAYLAVFFLLRDPLGTYAANVIAMAISAIGNTIAHAIFTFGPRSGVSMRQVATAGGLGFVTGVALTTLVLVLENAFGVFTASSEVVAILMGIVASAFVRLTLLRSFAFRTHTLRAGHEVETSAIYA
jgi:glycosyltransferase involved in cell wall biosynthesis/putative flippase GtrA